MHNDPRLRKPVHALAAFAVDIPIECCNVEQVGMYDDVIQHVGEFQSHVLVPGHGSTQVEILDVHCEESCPGVEIMLLMSSLMISKSAVGVPASNG